MKKVSSAKSCLNGTELYRISKQNAVGPFRKVLRATVLEQHCREQSAYCRRKSEAERNKHLLVFMISLLAFLLSQTMPH